MAKVPFRCHAFVYERYQQLYESYTRVAHDPDSPEALALVDEIHSLPGFPNYLNEHEDTVVPVLVTTPTL